MKALKPGDLGVNDAPVHIAERPKPVKALKPSIWSAAPLGTASRIAERPKPVKALKLSVSDWSLPAEVNSRETKACEGTETDGQRKVPPLGASDSRETKACEGTETLLEIRCG